MSQDYVHGYAPTEKQRLLDQSQILDDLLHNDTLFAPGSRVLEVGCGVGAQTCIVAQRNPKVDFTCIDVDEASLDVARANASQHRLSNVYFQRGDVRMLRLEEPPFDAALFCFVLEHLPEPERVLRHTMTLLRPGATLMAIEGDHGSTFFHPQSQRAWRTIQCLIDLQAACGGDALIGRRLYELFSGLGVTCVRVDPRVVYADPSRPEWVEWFTERTYVAMVQGAREQALGAGMIAPDDWDAGIADLRKAKKGSFSYTFFKAVGTTPTQAVHSG